VAVRSRSPSLFDVITDEAAAKMIVDTRNPEKAAIKLRDAAYAGGSTDNISVLVIHLPAFVAKYPAKIEEHLRTAHPS
jgi:serine/threonine protein phosphatase PrpC